MMTIQFLPPELKTLDRLRAQLLVVSVFEDERPLRGFGGLLDWRSCGVLSRFLLRGHVTGVAGEVVLFPVDRRLDVPQGILIGLGRMAAFEEPQFRTVTERIGRAAIRLGARSVVLQLPGSHRKALDPARTIGLFVELLAKSFSRITLLAPAAERREMTEVLRRRRGEIEVVSAPPAP
jgi:hypothetical protein